MSTFVHIILNSMSTRHMPASCTSLSLAEEICRGLPSKPRFLNKLEQTLMPQSALFFFSLNHTNSPDAASELISVFYHLQ